MTDIQIELLREEIALIQKRHYLFFPDTQKQYIRVQKNCAGYNQIFLEEYDLPNVVTMEIILAIKMIADLTF